MISNVRKNQEPHIEVINTYRLAPHSKGDDDRSIDEINSWKKKDPLKIIEPFISKEDVKNTYEEVNNRISSTINELSLRNYISILNQ